MQCRESYTEIAKKTACFFADEQSSQGIVSGLTIRRASFQPTPDPASEEDESEAVGWGEPWLVDLAVEDDELLAEEGVLRNEIGMGASNVEGTAEKDRIARRPGELEGDVFQRCQCGPYASDKPVEEGRHAEEAPGERSTPISG
jgi:hypothetical protein